MTDPNTNLTVRTAGHDDIQQLVELGRAMHLESNLSFLPFSEQKIVSLAEKMIGSNDTCCVFVAQRKDRLVGFMAGQLTYYFFCDEYFAIDQGLYVSPDCRGSSAAVRLISAYLTWAQNRRAREACIAVSTGVNLQMTDAILTRIGMEMVGGIYKVRTDRPEHCALRRKEVRSMSRIEQG
jgi:GNAT superfamily N-acetyltransferase